MGTTSVVVMSVACQAAAALLAIRLIWYTGKRLAWGMIAGAILLMLARRGVSLFRTVTGDAAPVAELAFELVGLGISGLMLLGIAGMFPVFRIVRDSERSLRASQQRLGHVNAVLRGIRNVGQIIAKEKDPHRLLHRVCLSLTESRGYGFVWIARLRDSQTLEPVAECGLGDRFLPLREMMQNGKTPDCLRRVLSQSQVRVLGDETSECQDCPLCALRCGKRTMAVRLAWGDEPYGIMVGSLPSETTIDEEGLSLFRETADDVSFALHGIHLEEVRLRAEKELRLDESRLETLLALNHMSAASFQEITNFALEQAVLLTQSSIGYLAFVNADETELTMHAWSKTAMDQCQIIDKPIVYQVKETGLWGEAVRRRVPVITNDYEAPNPAKKGYPQGHVHVKRHMNVPVIDEGRIVLVAGVGNKAEPYGESDIRQLTLLMQGMWQLVRRRRADEELRKARDELEVRVRERTAELANANEDLTQERHLLHTLMDYLPHNIYFKDAESRFLRVNKALAKYFGFEHPSQACGRTDVDFFSAQHAAQALADEREIVQTGRPVLDKEEKETWPDGRVTWASTTKMPLYNDSGQIVGTFGISRDITAQKQAEEALRTSEAKYRTLYDSSRDAIMTLAPERGFLSGNPAAIALFGCRDEEQFKSLTPADLSPEYQPDLVLSSVKARQMIATAVAQGVHFFEWTHRRMNGDDFFASVLLTRMELEGRTVLQATVRDISNEKRTAVALLAAKDAAEAASRAKSTFLANMSHEIRTPLNAIIGMTELVLETPLSAHQREFLAAVKDSGEALLGVINDILDFSRIEAGKLALDNSAFDLREVMGDAMKSLALRASKQDLELACRIATDVPGSIVGDPFRLRQIVVNLVGNAVKFTDRGEIVLDVAVETREDRNLMLHFTVRDTGIGIPEEKQTTIFSPFEQVDGTLTRRHGGSGLGLAISSRLVEQMGGRMWVDSQPNHGSTFHFTARFEVAAARPEPIRHIDPTSVHGLRILAVDDNATNRRILEEMLASWGAIPTTASGAREALQRMHEAHASGTPFRLVLTDAHMPEMDGFVLAEEIGKDPKTAGTAVIMLTSGDRPEDASRCEQGGIAAYLLKPVKQSELFNAMIPVLGIAGPKEEPAAAGQTPRLQQPLRILLAEDSLVNQKLAVALLERHGHTVVVANNGKQAVAAIEPGAFDLVLMDVQMPELDGLEATALIRAREKQSGDHVPIVAMTAHALKGDRERCLAAGMDGYISKPIHASELFETLERIMAPREGPCRTAGPPCAQQTLLDWGEVLAAMGGDQSLLQLVANTALEEAPQLVKAIEEAAATRDAAALRLAAHTLQGAIRYFGPTSVFEQACLLERAAQEGRLDEATTMLASLKEGVDRLLVTLTQYVSEGNSQNGS